MTTNNDGGIDREKLKELTSRIQVGDEDEGAEALQELVETTVERVRANERANARQAVDDRLLDLSAAKENKAALDKFAKRFGKAAEKPMVQAATVDRMRTEIASDLRSAGVTDEELGQIGGDLNRLGLLHAHARRVGHQGVRSAERLLDDVGQALTDELGIKPEGVGRTPEQYVRDLKRDRGFKVSDEDPAGRREGSRAPNAGRLTEDEMERNRAIVAQMRAARGFPASR
jgi:hypothetical protein